MNEKRFVAETLAMFFFLFRAIIRLVVLVCYVLAQVIKSLYNEASKYYNIRRRW